jgi:hypothetical protein
LQAYRVAQLAPSVDPRNRLTDRGARYAQHKARQAQRKPQHFPKMHLAGREADGDHELQIHQRVAGKQDCQINREGLGERYHQNGDRHKFQNLADGEAVEESGELHDQDFPQRVADGQGDFVRPLLPPVLHRKPPQPG